MNYIVLHDRGQYSGISIEAAGRVYQHPIKCWAINDGKRAMFARTRMHKVLNALHIGGTYESQAMYAVSFDELCHMIRGLIGPSDDERFSAAVERYEQAVAPKPEPQRTSHNVDTAVDVAFESTIFFTHMGMLIVKFLATMLLIPLIMAWIKKR